jgi:hypothetical protein
MKIVQAPVGISTSSGALLYGRCILGAAPSSTKVW